MIEIRWTKSEWSGSRRAKKISLDPPLDGGDTSSFKVIIEESNIYHIRIMIEGDEV